MSFRIGAATLSLSLVSISGMALGLLGCWPTADIECMQSARCLLANPVTPLVLGQPDEYTVLGLKLGLNQPTHAVRLGSQLFVADCGNHRVIIKNNLPVIGPAAPQIPDIVLGQPDLSTSVGNYGGRSASSLYLPHSLATDGTQLVVADSGNRRVLIWSSIPTRNAQPADFVIGQPDMVSSNIGVSDRSLADNPDVAMAGMLFVTDRGNHRVLMWKEVPRLNYSHADLVLGQADMNSNAPNHGLSSADASGLSAPIGAGAATGGRFMIADSGNHRVLAWNPIPISDGVNSQLVLGQTNFFSNTANRGLPTPNAGTLVNPTAVAISGRQESLAVADGANRVLIWKNVPLINGQDADYVLGQSDFSAGTANTGGLGAATLSAPQGVSFDGEDLYVAETGNNRVLNYVGPIDTIGQPAARVFGQRDFTSNYANNAGPVSGTKLSSPLGVSGTEERLAISDTGHARVLLYDELPTSSAALPSLALGQPDLGAALPRHGGGISGNGFTTLGGNWTDGTRLVVADNNRVLIWLSWPTSGLQSADLVLGQPDMVSDLPNNGGVSASSLWFPRVVYSDGTRLFVADKNNHRVLIWNTFPSVTGQPADRVLGQPDMTSNSGDIGAMYCNGGSPGASASAQSMSCPHGVATDGDLLYVADSANYRVLVFNRPIVTNGQPADVVLGQSDFSLTAARISATAGTFGDPNRIATKKGRLYVSDAVHNRVLYWNAPPTQNGQPADGVIGQPDFTSTLSNNGGLSFHSLNNPRGLFAAADRLFITDQDNQRVIAIPY